MFAIDTRVLYSRPFQASADKMMGRAMTNADNGFTVGCRIETGLLLLQALTLAVMVWCFHPTYPLSSSFPSSILHVLRN